MEKFLIRQLDKIQLDLTQDKNVCFSKKKMIKFKLTSRRYPPYSGPVYYQDQTGFDPFFVCNEVIVYRGIMSWNKE